MIMVASYYLRGRGARGATSTTNSLRGQERIRFPCSVGPGWAAYLDSWLPMQYVFLAVFVALLVVVAVQTRRTHRDTIPLRREAERQDISFQLRLDHVKVDGANAKGAMALTVRTDTFEVSALTPALRAFGLDCYFRAAETTIELGEIPLVSYIRKRTWIIVRSQQGRRKTEVALASDNHLYDAWVALVRAGATPLGPPPPVPRGS